MWQIGSIEDPGKSGMYIVAEDEHIWEYIHQLEEATCDACGEDPCICNKTESDINAEEWLKEYKGKAAETPEEATKDADFVFTCVGNDNDLREVAIGNKGIFNSINADKHRKIKIG